jgi:hypothetical protein
MYTCSQLVSHSLLTIVGSASKKSNVLRGTKVRATKASNYVKYVAFSESDALQSEFKERLDAPGIALRDRCAALGIRLQQLAVQGLKNQSQNRQFLMSRKDVANIAQFLEHLKFAPAYSMSLEKSTIRK